MLNPIRIAELQWVLNKENKTHCIQFPSVSVKESRRYRKLNSVQSCVFLVKHQLCFQLPKYIKPHMGANLSFITWGCWLSNTFYILKLGKPLSRTHFVLVHTRADGSQYWSSVPGCRCSLPLLQWSIPYSSRPANLEDIRNGKLFLDCWNGRGAMAAKTSLVPD